MNRRAILKFLWEERAYTALPFVVLGVLAIVWAITARQDDSSFVYSLF